jgi:acetolactate synthase-1/2/3 large subunit
MRSRAVNLTGVLLDDPPIDFKKLAQSFGVYGKGPIENPEEIRPALKKAVKEIKERRIPAIVDILISPV